MTQLKFKRITSKKLKKKYTLIVANTKKTTKYNTSIDLGEYNPNINLYIFKYSTILPFYKLGATFSKQFPLISSFYLKNVLTNKFRK